MVLGKILRFNRYIVECKGKTSFNSVSGFERFNRYIVECKVIALIVISSLEVDLIDTLWNVKNT